MKWGCCMISTCQKYLAILLTFICVIVLYPQSTYGTTGMFGLNTSDTTRLGLIACTDLREDNPFSFDLNFFHDFG